MSAIKAKIQEEVKNAMRAREQHRLDTLRGLVSEIKRGEIDTRTEMTDEQVTQVLQKEIKKRRDAIEYAKNAGRSELVENNEAEVAWIQAFLGEQLSEQALKTLIGDLIAGGNNNLGKIMGELNKTHKGKFEGKIASEIAKTLLGA